MVCGVRRGAAGIVAAVSYAVQTDVFEGPFDLLLHLIVRDEVDLYEISLARIVDGFLAYLDGLSTFDLEVTTEFLVIAATLVDLKARRLLPGPVDVEVDEELALFEQRDLLLARLIEAKTFRDAGGALERLAQAASRSLPRTAGLEERFLAVLELYKQGLVEIDQAVTFGDLEVSWVGESNPVLTSMDSYDG